MGIAKSRPEPMIEHLGKGHSQLWEHRWKQFTCATGKGGTGFHLLPKPHLRAGYLLLEYLASPDP